MLTTKSKKEIRKNYTNLRNKISKKLKEIGYTIRNYEDDHSNYQKVHPIPNDNWKGVDYIAFADKTYDEITTFLRTLDGYDVLSTKEYFGGFYIFLPECYPSYVNPQYIILKSAAQESIQKNAIKIELVAGRKITGVKTREMINELRSITEKYNYTLVATKQVNGLRQVEIE